MAGEGIHIRHKLRLAGARRSPADAARKRNHKAAMPPLIRTDLKQARFGDAVKARPIRHFMRVMKFASDGRHKCDRIGFAVTKRMQRLEKLGVSGIVHLFFGKTGVLGPGVCCA